MKLKQVFFLFLMVFSLAAFAQDEANEIDSEKEILRELDQIHSMGSQWSRKLEEARLRSSEIDKSNYTTKNSVRITESVYE